MRRNLVVGVIAVCLALLGVIAYIGWRSTLPPTGHAFRFVEGPTASVTTPVRRGSYAFSFPAMVNTTDRRIDVDGFKINDVPSDLVEMRWAVLDASDTNGWRPGFRVSRHAAGPDALRTYADHIGSTWIVGPHRWSPRYPVVVISNPGDATDAATGCEIFYDFPDETDGRVYHQQIDCRFRFAPKR